MRMQGRRESQNVEDRRRARGPMVAGGGLGMLVLILLVIFLGGDPRALLQQLPPPAAQLQQDPLDPEQEELATFVKQVLATTEDVWHKLFRSEGESYRDTPLVLFSGQVQSACGMASAAVGPFYCPADQKVYIDLAFYDELRNRFGAPGDFAQAYVIAHEVGHHVQNLLGITDKVDALRGRVSTEEYNQLSVRLELQADYFAGVWAHHAQSELRLLEEGDIEEGLRAASAIGDDRLQMQSQGYVVPDSFTHGTSAQRLRWFRKGLLSGEIADGDTFSAADL